MSLDRKIDIHHHICPPAYVKGLAGKHPIFPILLDWTPERSIEDMDRAGVETAIVSISTPGLWFGDDDAARRLARLCNEYGAGLVARYRRRFGFFAALPLPDVEGSLREVEHALDVLKADGICLYTSYGDKYLGDPAFRPVLEELNRRRAVIYTHPTINPCCVNIVPVVSEAIIEYGTDTTRAIASLLFSGAAARCRDARFIFSHAGGTMPFLFARFQQQVRNNFARGKGPPDVLQDIARFFYDTAQSCHAAPMAALRQIVAVSQIVFGTDFPWGKAQEHVERLADCDFNPDDIAAIMRNNALQLVPRLRS